MKILTETSLDFARKHITSFYDMRLSRLTMAWN